MNRCVAETDPLGRTTRAGYDAAGRQAWQETPTAAAPPGPTTPPAGPPSMAVDGRTVTALDARPARAGPSGSPTTPARRHGVEHELEWNRRGQLVRRTPRRARGRRGPTTPTAAAPSMTTPDGTHHPLRLRRRRPARLGRPPAARPRDVRPRRRRRLVAALAGGLIQSWEHRDGFVVAHTVTDADGATRTDDRPRRRRPHHPRHRDRRRPASTTDYAYDGACQLIEARTGPATRLVDAVALRRRRPPGRRVDRRRGPSSTSTTPPVSCSPPSTPTAATTRYTYDGARPPDPHRATTDGRVARVRVERRPATSPASSDRAGDRSARTTLHADALGELAIASTAPSSSGTPPPTPAPRSWPATPRSSPPDPSRASATGWTAPGWRTARSHRRRPVGRRAGTRPARRACAARRSAPSGELSVDGLEWLGARVYDPASRGFLSVDPLDPVAGAGWAGNPYSYAGNDPLHALDPTGLRPVTDAELAAYRDQQRHRRRQLAGVGDWIKNNWEYVAGGAMVIAGGVLIATGVGGPAGHDAGLRRRRHHHPEGHHRRGQLGPGRRLRCPRRASAGRGSPRALGLTGTRAAVVAGVSSGGISGGVMSGYQYATGPGPHTPGGFARATIIGTGSGALLGGAGGGAGHAIGGRIMNSMTHNPGSSTMTMGRFMETRVIPYADTHGFGYYRGTPTGLYNAMDNHLPDSVAERANMWINNKWINYQMMEGKNLVDIGMPDGWTGGTGPYYGMELDQVSGYGQYSQDIQAAGDLR